MIILNKCIFIRDLQSEINLLLYYIFLDKTLNFNGSVYLATKQILYKFQRRKFCIVISGYIKFCIKYHILFYHVKIDSPVEIFISKGQSEQKRSQIFQYKF